MLSGRRSRGSPSGPNLEAYVDEMYQGAEDVHVLPANLSLPGMGVLCRFTSSGLKSKVSTWLSAPEQKMHSSRRALGSKCVRRGA